MLREIAGFVRLNLWHLILVVPGALLVTVVHESAHAFAAVVQGGALQEFVWLPSKEGWGHVNYTVPNGAGFSHFAVLIAPYVLWTVLALGTGLLGLSGKIKSLGLRARSFIFVWFFFVPLADIANTDFPFTFLGATTNDFSYAFGSPDPLFVGTSFLAVFLAAWGGYCVQRQYFQERCLSPWAYGILTTGMLALIATLLLLPRFLLGHGSPVEP